MRLILIVFCLLAECFTSVFALEPSPVIAEKVEVRDKALFEAIDSLIQTTDHKMTIKPEYRDKVRDSFNTLTLSRDDSKYQESTENTADDEFWLFVYAGESSNHDHIGDYYFTTPHYRFVSYHYDAKLFKKKLGTKKCIGYNYLWFDDIGPSWYFKIKDSRILEAYYHYDELDDFKGVVYDILNKKIVSEGYGEIFN